MAALGAPGLDTAALGAGPPAPARPTARTARARALQLALYATPLIVFAVQAWIPRWMVDDGFINLRVVRQLEAGNGPVWNAGQRVEAVTSPLWVGVLTVGGPLLPLRLEWVAVVLGIAASVTGLGLAIAGSARLWDGSSSGAPLVPIGALVALALYPCGSSPAAGWRAASCSRGWAPACSSSHAPARRRVSRRGGRRSCSVSGG